MLRHLTTRLRLGLARSTLATRNFSSAAGASRGQRFAVIATGDSPPELSSSLGSYSELFVRWLRDPDADEQWDVVEWYKGARFDVASLDELDYDGYVLTGSKADAHAREEWIMELEEFVRGLYARQRRVLGICFGHQLVANALGGRSDRSHIWELGQRPLTVTEAFRRRYAPHVDEDTVGALTVLQTHQDAVHELPPDAEALGSSPSCKFEAFHAPKENPTVLCMQGHPEFSVEYSRRLMLSKEDVVPSDVLQRSLATLATIKDGEVNPEWFRNVFRDFLKGKRE